MSARIEHLILSGLFHRPEFVRRAMAYLKPHYFKDATERLLFQKIITFFGDYNTAPSKEAIEIELDGDHTLKDEQFRDAVQLLSSVHALKDPSDLQWLVDTVEGWAKDAAIEAAILASIKIIRGEDKKHTRGMIPQLLTESLAVSFNPSVGMELIDEDFGARWDLYHANMAERIPTNLKDLNEILNGGFAKKTLNIFMGQSNIGKAIPHGTIVPTPDGPRQFGDLKVGDRVFGSNGRPTFITAVYPQGSKHIFELHFSDGRIAPCCDQHLWAIHRSGLKSTVMSTLEVQKSLRLPTYAKQTFVPLCDPVEIGPKQSFFISPYILGCLLGDGHLRQEHVSISNPETEVIERINRELPDGHSLSRSANTITYYITSNRTRPHPFKQELDRLGLEETRSDTKFIPSDYLNSAISQRIDLLNGLLDTDGEVTKTGGTIVYTTTSDRLRDDVCALVWGLGGKVSVHTKQKWFTHKGVRKLGKPAHCISITFGSDSPIRSKLFHCERKRLRFASTNGKPSHLRITQVVKTDRIEECSCITVDADDHLFLTNDFIVTHNSLTMCSLSAGMIMEGRHVLYVSAEMGKPDITQRLEANLLDLTMKDLGDIDRSEYVRRMETLAKRLAGRFIVEQFPTGAATVTDIRNLMDELRIKKKFVPDMVVVDYINICRSARVAADNTYMLIKNIAEEFRGLAIERDVAVLSATQVRRDAFDAALLSMKDVPESKALVDTVDYLGGLTIPPEFRHENYIMMQTLKTRYGDSTQADTFAVEINRGKQRLSDLNTQPIIVQERELATPSKSKKEQNEMSVRRTRKLGSTGFG